MPISRLANRSKISANQRYFSDTPMFSNQLAAAASTAASTNSSGTYPSIMLATGLLVGSVVANENQQKFEVSPSARTASCESSCSKSSNVAESQRKFISILADNMPDSSRFLERRRITIQMDEWHDIVEKVHRSLPTTDENDDDGESDGNDGDEDVKDDDTGESSKPPPIPPRVKAYATAPLTDENTNLNLEILFVKDQHNRLIGATMFDETAKKGQCPFTIIPNKTGQVRVYAVYKRPDGKSGDRMYFTPPIAIPGVPKTEDDSDGDDKWVPCA